MSLELKKKNNQKTKNDTNLSTTLYYKQDANWQNFPASCSN